ncbi:MAG: C13 family peptidase [Sphingomonas sp.]
MPFFQALTPEQAARFADGGVQIEHHRAPAALLAEHRRVDRALASLLPQRKGVVDAYVIAMALDSDPVFGREAREAGRVLARRYDAAGRTLTFAGSEGHAPSALAMGSPDTLALALARVAELMDRNEDVLVLYTTSHGAPFGLVYNDADQGFGVISATALANQLDALGITRRVIIISACYSGVFIPVLSGEDAAVLTASAGDRTSFGCKSDNDWTFFGDALVNNALRKRQPLAEAGAEAARLITDWEGKGRLTPSLPQMLIGARATIWLAMLDKRTPKLATAPVGTPSVALLDAR